MQPHFDWRLAQELFGWSRVAAPSVPVALINNAQVVALFRVGPSARREWIGASEKDFRARWPDALLFQEAEWDRTFRGTNQNREQLRELTRRAIQGMEKNLKREFQSWLSQDGWFEELLAHPFLRRMIPHQFGLMVHFDDAHDIFLRVNGNRVQSIEAVEHKNPTPEVRLKALQDRDAVPVQGVALTSALWDEIRTSPRPWKRVQAGLWRQEIEFFPKRKATRWYVLARSFSALKNR